MVSSFIRYQDSPTDDFVLLCYLIGNDFIPAVPGLGISEGSLTLLFDTYKEVLPTLGGYLVEDGQFSPQRLIAFLASVNQQLLDDAEDVKQRQAERQEAGNDVDEEEEEEPTFDPETWYVDKLKFVDGDQKPIDELVFHYFESLAWCLHYYFHGCVSWSWFYPYHYAPLLGDLAQATGEFEFKFQDRKSTRLNSSH